ncbi:ROK family transcriptional regulator [Streptomyces sp. NPDC002911]
MLSPPRSETFPANPPAVSQIFVTTLSQGPLTRLELARRAGLSPAAVTKAVRPLIEAGYLVESADEEARPALGRPASLVRVDGGRALFIGIKITGDEAIGVLTDLRCRVLLVRRLPLADRAPHAVLTTLAGLTQELLTEADDLGVHVVGAGVAVSGDVDRAAGMVRYSPFLQWREVPLAELAAMTTGLPVTVDNDVRALTVAEQWFGAGVGLSDFALVTVGAGIGNRGCVEAIAGDAAIVGRVRTATGVEVADAAHAAALAHDGVPGAREAYARAGEAIGRGIATVANLFGPERVIISGEGLAAYDLFATQMRDAFATAAFGSAAECDVQTRPLPFEEWARGAAATAIQSYIGSEPHR